MTTAATDIVARIAKLSDDAFAAFCEDIGGMFGVEMRCDRRQILTAPVRSLKDHFKKLTAVHLSKADGALNGTFHLVFDQGGLFILSGVIVMLPESRIVEEAKRGSAEDAANLQDAAREVGNLLMGSWDRVFRESCPGHQHFVKTSTFIGKPWDKPEQIELQAATEVEIVLYEMAVEPYPSFTCAAVFPSALLSSFTEANPDAEAAVSETPGEPQEVNKTAAEPPAQPVQTPPAPAVSQKPAEPAGSGTSAAGAASAPQPAAQPAAAKVGNSPAAPPASQPPVAKEAETPVEAAPVAPVAAAPVAAAPARPPADQAAPAPATPSRNDGVIPPGRGTTPVDVGMLPSELASVQSGGASRS
ncbi:MAG: hypothetical protein ABFE01_01990, partial [Phycisphaerales bacterium]